MDQSQIQLSLWGSLTITNSKCCLVIPDWQLIISPLASTFPPAYTSPILQGWVYPCNSPINLPSASLLGTGHYLQEADCALFVPPAPQSALTKQPVENRYPRWNPGDTEVANAKAAAAQIGRMSLIPQWASQPLAALYLELKGPFVNHF